MLVRVRCFIGRFLMLAAGGSYGYAHIMHEAEKPASSDGRPLHVLPVRPHIRATGIRRSLSRDWNGDAPCAGTQVVQAADPLGPGSLFRGKITAKLAGFLLLHVSAS